MTTSISSEARRNQTSLSLLGAEKIKFSPKPDGQTDIRTGGRTYGWTDIFIYRVASLLITCNLNTYASAIYKSTFTHK